MNNRKHLDDLPSKKGRSKNPVKIVRMYKCMVCNEKFTSRITLGEHKLLHTTIKPFECMYCEYKSSLKDIMKNHISIQHGVNLKRNEINSNKRYDIIVQEYKCTICNGQFATKKDVHDHHLVNKMCKPDTCSYCDETPTKTNVGVDPVIKDENNSNSEFDDMVIIATENVNKGVTVYKCTVCNEQFQNKSCLFKHNSSHSGLKTFGCGHCNYRCSLKGIMKNHLQIRHGIAMKSSDIIADRKDKVFLRAFRCTSCYKVLPTKERLKKHLMTNPECNRFRCLLCDYKTAVKGTLNRHMQMKHNDLCDKNTDSSATTETDVETTSLDGCFEEIQQEFKMEIGPNMVFPNIPIKQEDFDDEVSSDMETKYNINKDLASTSANVESTLIDGIFDHTQEEFKMEIGPDVLLAGYVKGEDITDAEIVYMDGSMAKNIDGYTKEIKLAGYVKEENITDDEIDCMDGRSMAENIGGYTKKMMDEFVKEENIIDEIEDIAGNDGDVIKIQATDCLQGGTIYYFTEDCIIDGNVTVDTCVKEEIVTDDKTLELFHNKILKDA